jgi:hypothetical protein
LGKVFVVRPQGAGSLKAPNGYPAYVRALSPS